MADISHYEHSDCIFERAAFWLARMSWRGRDNKEFETMQELSRGILEEAKCLRDETERLTVDDG